jgi:hypothetical protein
MEASGLLTPKGWSSFDQPQDFLTIEKYPLTCRTLRRGDLSLFQGAIKAFVAAIENLYQLIPFFS